MTSVVGLIARREIASRVQQKSYRIGLLVAVAIAIVAVVLPSLFSGGNGGRKTYDIAVVSPSADLRSALATAARAQGAAVRLHVVDAATARQAVADGRDDAALLPGTRIIAHKRGDTVVSIVQNGAALARTIERLGAAGVTPASALSALASAPLPVTATESGQDAQRQTIAIVTVVVLFSQLVTFCTWVAMGVVEEKSSRIVELLLSSVRPLQLLAGKLLGIGVLAAAQVAVLGAAAVIAATLAGTVTLPAADLLTVLISFVAFLLGFAFFAALSAALASTVSRQEEVSSVLTPVTVSLTLCYVAAFAVATAGDSTFLRVISLIPPISAIAMPARISRGDVPAWEVVLAIAALLLATAGILRLAARIYRASILHTGSRVKLREAWGSGR